MYVVSKVSFHIIEKSVKLGITSTNDKWLYKKTAQNRHLMGNNVKCIIILHTISQSFVLELLKNITLGFRNELGLIAPIYFLTNDEETCQYKS